MKILNGKHLTATDRRALAGMVKNNWTIAQSKRKRFHLTYCRDGTAIFKVTSMERDDWGRPVSRLTCAHLDMGNVYV